MGQLMNAIMGFVRQAIVISADGELSSSHRRRSPFSGLKEGNPRVK